MTLREVEHIALTETELQTLIAQQFPTDRLRVVRDIFLFRCYIGLAYAHVKKLKRSQIIIGVDGEQWLLSRRQKTRGIQKTLTYHIAWHTFATTVTLTNGGAY